MDVAFRLNKILTLCAAFRIFFVTFIQFRKMSRVVALTFVRLMVALILVECLLSVCLPLKVAAPGKEYISQQTISTALWTALAASPEEEKVEEKADKSFTIQIGNLLENLVFLSRIHTSPQSFALYSLHHDSDHSSLLAFLCVFLI